MDKIHKAKLFTNIRTGKTKNLTPLKETLRRQFYIGSRERDIIMMRNNSVDATLNDQDFIIQSVPGEIVDTTNEIGTSMTLQRSEQQTPEKKKKQLVIKLEQGKLIN